MVASNCGPEAQKKCFLASAMTCTDRFRHLQPFSVLYKGLSHLAALSGNLSMSQPLRRAFERNMLNERLFLNCKKALSWFTKTQNIYRAIITRQQLYTVKRSLFQAFS